MARVIERREIAAAPAAIWELAGDFSRAGEWCSGIVSLQANGNATGATRVIDIGGASPLIERLETIDQAARALVYSVLSGPLPVEDYVARIEVADTGLGTSIVTYSADFTPAGLPAEKCDRIFSKALSASLDTLEHRFAS